MHGRRVLPQSSRLLLHVLLRQRAVRAGPVRDPCARGRHLHRQPLGDRVRRGDGGACGSRKKCHGHTNNHPHLLPAQHGVPQRRVRVAFPDVWRSVLRGGQHVRERRAGRSWRRRRRGLATVLPRRAHRGRGRDGRFALLRRRLGGWRRGYRPMLLGGGKRHTRDGCAHGRGFLPSRRSPARRHHGARRRRASPAAAARQPGKWRGGRVCGRVLREVRGGRTRVRAFLLRGGDTQVLPQGGWRRRGWRRRRRLGSRQRQRTLGPRERVARERHDGRRQTFAALPVLARLPAARPVLRAQQRVPRRRSSRRRRRSLHPLLLGRRGRRPRGRRRRRILSKWRRPQPPRAAAVRGAGRRAVPVRDGLPRSRVRARGLL